MWTGSVLSLHITSAEGEPMRTIDEAFAVPGRGLKGDRYYLGTGHFSPHHGPSYEITLIEIEVLEALMRDSNCELSPNDARRNIVTIGVPLNHLVKKEFRVGSVRLLGQRLCEPCLHLAKLTNIAALSGLIHRGGLRAQILTEGFIYPGDKIEICE